MSTRPSAGPAAPERVLPNSYGSRQGGQSGAAELLYVQAPGAVRWRTRRRSRLRSLVPAREPAQFGRWRCCGGPQPEGARVAARCPRSVRTTAQRTSRTGGSRRRRGTRRGTSSGGPGPGRPTGRRRPSGPPGRVRRRPRRCSTTRRRGRTVHDRGGRVPHRAVRWPHCDDRPVAAREAGGTGR